MVNKRYTAGRRYEYKRMNELRAEGFHVTRSAGSHGTFDLIAVKPAASPHEFGHIRLIQLKTGKSKERAIAKVSQGGIEERYDGLYLVKVEVE